MTTIFAALAAPPLEQGSEAPDFTLQDQRGHTQTLSAYRGRWVILYFYPKDNTPGCTAEACAFRDDFVRLQQMRVVVLGISLDSVDSHRRFADRHGLPFPLLADPRGKVAAEYAALWSMGPIRFARRHSFIIDPRGRIARAYRSVEPGAHSAQVIADLQALGAGVDGDGEENPSE